MQHIVTTPLFAAGLIAVMLLSACTNRNEVSFRSEDVIETVTQGQAALRGNFPLPIYPRSKPAGSVSAASAQGRDDNKFMILSSPDPLTTVASFYQDRLNSTGWITESTQSFPTMVNITASKRDLEGAVMLTSNGSNTTINLSIGKKEVNPDSIIQSKPAEESVRFNRLNPPTD